ncbi:hypothetical protein KAU33_10905 [Candidatus Dependentiae bacterium]|nr:hypothetical protein [Candidatus Dependentiae bacterium]
MEKAQKKYLIAIILLFIIFFVIMILKTNSLGFFLSYLDLIFLGLIFYMIFVYILRFVKKVNISKRILGIPIIIMVSFIIILNISASFIKEFAYIRYKLTIGNMEGILEVVQDDTNFDFIVITNKHFIKCHITDGGKVEKEKFPNPLFKNYPFLLGLDTVRFDLIYGDEKVYIFKYLFKSSDTDLIIRDKVFKQRYLVFDNNFKLLKDFDLTSLNKDAYFRFANKKEKTYCFYHDSGNVYAHDMRSPEKYYMMKSTSVAPFSIEDKILLVLSEESLWEFTPENPEKPFKPLVKLNDYPHDFINDSLYINYSQGYKKEEFKVFNIYEPEPKYTLSIRDIPEFKDLNREIRFNLLYNVFLRDQNRFYFYFSVKDDMVYFYKASNNKGYNLNYKLIFKTKRKSYFEKVKLLGDKKSRLYIIKYLIHKEMGTFNRITLELTEIK